MKVVISSSKQEAKTIFKSLLRLDILLVILFIITNIIGLNISPKGIRQWFDLDNDLSIPNWYSSIKLFVISVLLFIASKNNRYNRYIPSYFLYIIGCVFMFLSADEGAAIHEKLTRAAKTLQLNWLLIKGHGAWIIIYSLLAFPLILLSIRYFRVGWRYFRSEITLLFCGITTYLTGAISLEIISYLFLRSESTIGLYKIEVICEEFLEMSGVSIILYSVLLFGNSVASAPGLKVKQKVRRK